MKRNMVFVCLAILLMILSGCRPTTYYVEPVAEAVGEAEPAIEEASPVVEVANDPEPTADEPNEEYPEPDCEYLQQDEYPNDDIDEEPHPTNPTNLAEALLLHHDLLPGNPRYIPLPPGHSFRALATGDLTGNGLYDIAILFTAYESYYNDAGEKVFQEGIGYRHLYILLAKAVGGFEIAWSSHNALMHTHAAGRFGDGGFMGMYIQDGVLSISQVAGSAWSVGSTKDYAIRDGNLILIREETTDFHSTAGNWYTEVYYPETGEILIYTAIPCDEQGYIELVLFSHTTTPGRTYDLTDEDSWSVSGARRWRHDEEWQHATLLFDGPLDYMYPWYSFGSIQLSDMNLSASAALTMVRDELFPGFARVYFMLEQEILDSFSIIAGYEVAGFFYTDGTQVLAHYASYIHLATEKPQHQINLLYDEIELPGGTTMFSRVRRILVDDYTEEILQ